MLAMPRKRAMTIPNNGVSDRVGPGEATAGVREAVEFPVVGAFLSPTFLSTD